ncbi:hypothetical protein GCM10010170_102830 [Dactylosporangium salmoneum]|uniref:Uncharacterized protein n=1 Tax=Dactylosporangium salmoneum TaxID=53361 RepID=A0ABP5V2G0_9ACTN
MYERHQAQEKRKTRNHQAARNHQGDRNYQAARNHRQGGVGGEAPTGERAKRARKIHRRPASPSKGRASRVSPRLWGR